MSKVFELWYEHLPRTITPALRSFFTTSPSSGTIDPRRAKDPAVVLRPTFVTKAIRYAETQMYIVYSPSDETVAILSCDDTEVSSF